MTLLITAPSTIYNTVNPENTKIYAPHFVLLYLLFHKNMNKSPDT